ncbi:MAG: hypothetical protein ACP6IY_00615 [Promethearchaeia archaeon]
MSEDPKEPMDKDNGDSDDLKAFLSELESIDGDLSEIEDFDPEELKEIQAAIEMVKQEENNYEKQKEMLASDFSDVDDLGLEELQEMKEAIEAVRKSEIDSEDSEQIVSTQEISPELEQKIKEELERRKEKEKEEIITPEKFLNYIKTKRDKIWYHALWHLTFNVEDHIASKELLYDVLKEDTSKSPIDPIPYHQFVFGLGYILRLNLNNKRVIRYLSGGKFKINVNIDTLKDLLIKAGPPIIRRPIIKEEEQKRMFSDFLKDDFSDI